ncbi:MAG: hypothetical protein KGH61_00360 [Candidatus Micrarchaeota archaeon]|nr:hypothetical protein [Candidatus Micrarchaeota archaeon]MDE1847389.1 hypothetical protein [Candidatus Micrarchaeota archaeon]MDE1864004.1 hypothetical protein [Candidatus Micrarchaeota archaeon]
MVAIALLAQTAYAAHVARLIPNATADGGMLDSRQVTIAYSLSQSYFCSPSLQSLFGNSSEVTNALTYTNCEAGVFGNMSEADPEWSPIPIYAGFSIFGLNASGSSPLGFATFQNNVIVTDCGAGGTVSACPEHPHYLYSPFFTMVEHKLNITNGMYGLSEGVLPMPTHDHIVETDDGQALDNWYVVAVLVLDPNIMPNASTGTCKQVVPSDLANATGNCLTSLQAMARAMQTNSSSVAYANKGNPFWEALREPNSQIVMPGIPLVTMINNSNMNLDIPFAVKDFDYFNPPSRNSSLQSTIPQTSSSAQSTTSLLTIASIVLIIVAVGIARLVQIRRKRQ